jgi:hypothetical protein
MRVENFLIYNLMNGYMNESENIPVHCMYIDKIIGIYHKNKIKQKSGQNLGNLVFYCTDFQSYKSCVSDTIFM